MKDTNRKVDKINRYFKYCIVFFIPIICLLVHMAIKGCYPFGNNTILLGDANLQYYAFFVELADKIQDGGSLFFSWKGGMGYDFYANLFYYLGSPFNVIALLFGKSNMELGMIVTMLVQIGGCGITMLYYLAHTKNNKLRHGRINNILCMLFALAYAMCDYMLAYQYNLMWLISLMLVPLIMLGIERMIDNQDVRLYFVVLFLTLITNFYFAWFICIFAIIWFIDQQRGGVKEFFKQFVRFVLTSVVAALCSAVVLIPCYISALARPSGWMNINNYSLLTFGKLSNFIQSFFWGHIVETGGPKLFTEHNYCGLIVIVLVFVFIFNRNIDKGHKIKRMLEIAVLSLCLNWILPIYVLHGFTFPHGLSNRFAFMLTILLIITAFESICAYSKIHIKWIVTMEVIFIAAFAVAVLKNDYMQDALCYLVSILIITYILILFILLERNSIKQTTVIINIIVIGFIELVSNMFFIYGGAYDVSAQTKTKAKEWKNVYESIDTENMERKTSWMLEDLNMLYTDTNIFASSLNFDLLALFDSLGMTYQNNGSSYIYRCTTPVTSVMFNVKSVLTDEKAYYGGYKEVESYQYYDYERDVYKKYELCETDYVNGIGFMVPNDIRNWSIENEDPFAVQNDFLSKITGTDDVFTEVYMYEFEDFNVLANGDAIEEVVDNRFKYINLLQDTTTYQYLQFNFIIPYDMHLYVCLRDDDSIMPGVAIDDEVIVAGGKHKNPCEVLDLGELKAGQRVNINAYNNTGYLEESITSIYLYEYHEDKMQECMNKLKSSTLNLEEYDDTSIRGNINVAEAGLLYTAIPYYKGFKVYVDGKRTDIVGIGNDALIGVELDAGEHTIEFKFTPYCFWLGVAISCTGLFISVLYMINFKRKKKVM